MPASQGRAGPPQCNKNIAIQPLNDGAEWLFSTKINSRRSKNDLSFRETGFACETEEEGQIVINARLFGDIVRRMPDDTLTLTSDEKLTVKLHCGDADFDIIALPAADFPELPEVCTSPIHSPLVLKSCSFPWITF